MVKVTEREQALALRRNGHSYNFIAKHIGVSKSTLSVWLAEVPYTPNEETIRRIGAARAAATLAKANQKQESIRQAGYMAHLELGNLSFRDRFVLGLGLYLAAGVKTDIETRLVHSDPKVAAFMLAWLEDCLAIPRKNIRIRLHCSASVNRDDAISFWSQSLSLPLRQFHDPVVDQRRTAATSKKGRAQYGTAHIMVRSLGERRFGVFLARKIRAWTEIVLENQMRD